MAALPDRRRPQRRGALFLDAERVAAAPGQVPSLDGLRAVSVLLVLFAHIVNEKYFPGGLGVLIFFLISGFLITRLLFAEFKSTGAVSLEKFYVRRVLRLVPAIVAFTIVVVAAFEIFLPDQIHAIEPISALAYFANYLYADYSVRHAAASMPFQVFWSLAVEWHFYMVFPAAFLVLRGNARSVLVLVASVCAVSLLVRLAEGHLHPQYLSTYYFYFRSETRMDSIATGVLIAAACELDGGRRAVLYLSRPLFVGLALIVVAGCLALRDPWFRETIRYTLLNMACAVLLCAVVFRAELPAVNRVLNTAVLVWIGELSYSLYVWHEGVSRAVSGFLPHLAKAVQIPLIFSACFAAAAASYYLIEQPVRKWGGRFTR